MNKCYGYIRVSTVRQGVSGVSLQAQREAIQQYATKHGLQLIDWFEEQQTAAKRGRPVLGRMLKLLKSGHANGVIMHKIDRGARNLRDWADLAELMDLGIIVHFANDGLDMSSRGGRLSADIQAVVAADFIRNLSDETKKGLRGRLQQGVYPWPAPLGYLNPGPGKPKEICPLMGPLIRQAFELYDTGQFTLASLTKAMATRGLRNTQGSAVPKSCISRILNNRFYTGVIHIARTGETYEGKHEVLVPTRLFERVKARLEGRFTAKVQVHEFAYRRAARCVTCSKCLIGERQKGHVYYRCHTSTCPRTCLREEDIDTGVLTAYSQLAFSEDEVKDLGGILASLSSVWETERRERLQALTALLGRVDERLSRLTDAFLDEVLDRDGFNAKRSQLLEERAGIVDSIAGLPETGSAISKAVMVLLDRGTLAYHLHHQATTSEKRKLLSSLSSNIAVDVKNVDVRLRPPFDFVSACTKSDDCSPHQGGPRTMEQIAQVLWDFCVKEMSEEGKECDLNQRP